MNTNKIWHHHNCLGPSLLMFFAIDSVNFLSCEVPTRKRSPLTSVDIELIYRWYKVGPIQEHDSEARLIILDNCEHSFPWAALQATLSLCKCFMLQSYTTLNKAAFICWSYRTEYKADRSQKMQGDVSPQCTDDRRLRTKHSLICGEHRNNK